MRRASGLGTREEGAAAGAVAVPRPKQPRVAFAPGSDPSAADGADADGSVADGSVSSWHSAPVAPSSSWPGPAGARPPLPPARSLPPPAAAQPALGIPRAQSRRSASQSQSDLARVSEERERGVPDARETRAELACALAARALRHELRRACFAERQQEQLQELLPRSFSSPAGAHPFLRASRAIVTVSEEPGRGAAAAAGGLQPPPGHAAAADKGDKGGARPDTSSGGGERAAAAATWWPASFGPGTVLVVAIAAMSAIAGVIVTVVLYELNGGVRRGFASSGNTSSSCAAL